MRSRHASIVGQLSKDVFAVCLQTPRCQWLSPLRLIQFTFNTRDGDGSGIGAREPYLEASG